MDSGIGARVRAFRQWRRMSLRACADLAGIPRSTLSDIELGKYPLDRKSHIDALALALRVAPTELAGQPYPPVPDDLPRSRAQARVDSIRVALMETEMGAMAEPARPLPELVSAARKAGDHNLQADIATAMRLLPDTLTGLAACSRTGDEKQQKTALRALVEAQSIACSVLIALGYPDLGWVAAMQARQAAARLDEPAYIGRAEFGCIRAMTPYSRRARHAERAVALLEPHAAADDLTAQMYGMLHLMAAYDAAVVGGDVAGHLAEAQSLADRLGECTGFHTSFGPANTVIWRVSIAVEQGEGGRVREFATVDAHTVSRHRLSNYHRDMFRALAQDGHDTDALPHLLEAERLYPEEVRNNTLARQAAVDMLNRARRASTGPDLRGVAHRMGIA